MNARFLLYSLLVSIGLYFVLWLVYFEQIQNTLVFFTSAIFMLMYHLILILSVYIKNAKSEVFVIYVVFVFLLTGIFNAIFIDHRGDNFEFTGSDSLTYERYSLAATEFGYFEGVQDFVESSKYGYDDAGMIYYLSFLYRIIKDPLFPRFVNVFLSILTVFMMYSLARTFLEDQTARIMTLMFGAASYTVYYMASGLKETLFVFLIILSLYCYKLYRVDKKKQYIWYMVLAVASIFLFRIPVALFLLFAIIGSEVLRKSKSVTTILVVTSIAVLVIVVYVVIFRAFGQYLYYLNPETQGTEVMPSGLLFRAIAVIVGFFGPFPNIPTVAGKEADSLWAASLILKGFVSVYFVYGIFLGLKTKHPILLVSVLFCSLNLLSLVAIGKVFKVRYIMPYLPLFFLLAGYAYDTITNNEKYKVLKQLILPVNIGVVLLFLLWNILRI